MLIQSTLSYSATANHGRREIRTRSSTLPWEATMKQKLANYSLITCSPSWMKHLELKWDFTEMTVVRSSNRPQRRQRIKERIKKEMCKLFKECELKITIEANKKVVNATSWMLPWIWTRRNSSHTPNRTMKHPTLHAQQIKSSAQYHQKYIGISQEKALRNFIWRSCVQRNCNPESRSVVQGWIYVQIGV